jgi:hypothetical protein
MIEVLFVFDGIEKKEMAIFDTYKEMKDFIKTFKEEVLENYPTATNIRLGRAYIGVNS